MVRVFHILLVSSALIMLTAGSVQAQETALPGDTASDVLDTVPPGPPCSLTVRDYLENSDFGDKIEIEWGLSPDDGSGAGDVTGYVLRRSLAEGEVGEKLDEITNGTTRYIDESVEPGTEYYYSLEAYDGANSSEPVLAGPVAGRANMFQWSRLPVLVLMVVFFAMVAWFTAAAGKGAKLFVRRIPGLNAIEEAVGRATEMGRPVLYVPGIGEIDNIMTIASLNILSHVAKITARYDTPLIVPTARAVVMSAAEEVVKQAYAEVGNPDAYNPDNIRYLSDAQFAFAGAVNGIMLREKPAANLYMGAFWAESLLLAETGFEAGAIQVAGTAMVSQLPFFVTACDFTLMGEELYAASAYLSREPKLLGGLKGSDWMKVVSIALIAAGIIARAVGLESFVAWFQTQ